MVESPHGPTDHTAARSRWDPAIAVVANLIVPPVGHLHVGALERGGVLTVIAMALTVADVMAFARFPRMATLVIAVAVGIGIAFAVAGDALRIALRRPAGGARPPWYMYVGVAFSSLLIWGVVKGVLKSTVVHAFRMPSESMAPTLEVGDYFFADMGAYRHKPPQRGDIAIYLYPADPRQIFAKRVVGLPNETIELRDREVWLDGELLREPHVRHTDAAIEPAEESPRDNMPARTSGPEDVFLMGDNRENSNDSRFTGTVPVQQLKGKATFIYWSMGPGGVRWDRIGLPLDR
jgi:signal peptidase I